jgi:hypothetical protein
MAIVRLALGVVVAGIVLCACSTGSAAPSKTEASTVQVQAGHILNEISQLKTGSVGVRCTASACSNYGSSGAPIVAGLVRAAQQLQKLHFPAQDRTEVSAVNTQLRLMTSDLRQQPSPNESNEDLISQVKAELIETESLSTAMNQLRSALHLPAVKPSGSSWMNTSGHLGG